jgi:hypothetical protein
MSVLRSALDIALAQVAALTLAVILLEPNSPKVFRLAPGCSI